MEDSKREAREAREARIAEAVALVAQGATAADASRACSVAESTMRPYLIAARHEAPRATAHERIATLARDGLERAVSRIHREIDDTDPRNVALWTREARETYLSVGQGASGSLGALATDVLDRIAAAGVSVSIRIEPSADSAPPRILEPRPAGFERADK